jgi:hypothetical protein
MIILGLVKQDLHANQYRLALVISACTIASVPKIWGAHEGF